MSSMTRAGRSAPAAILAALLAAGCPSSPDGQHDGGPDEDGGEDEVGLIISFEAKDELPASAGEATVVRIDMALRNLRAIGDAAPGDARTTREMYAMYLAPDQESDPIAFMSAPPGIYSRIEATIDGSAAGTPSYRITGSIPVGAEEHPFEIVDDAVLPVVVPLSSLELKPGDVVEIGLQIDIGALVEAVDLELVAPDPDGTVRIDQDDAEIGMVRAIMEASFKAESGS